MPWDLPNAKKRKCSCASADYAARTGQVQRGDWPQISAESKGRIHQTLETNQETVGFKDFLWKLQNLGNSEIKKKFKNQKHSKNFEKQKI